MTENLELGKYMVDKDDVLYVPSEHISTPYYGRGRFVPIEILDGQIVGLTTKLLKRTSVDGVKAMVDEYLRLTSTTSRST